MNPVWFVTLTYYLQSHPPPRVCRASMSSLLSNFEIYLSNLSCICLHHFTYSVVLGNNLYSNFCIYYPHSISIINGTTMAASY
jgi:hypothetical protein